MSKSLCISSSSPPNPVSSAPPPSPLWLSVSGPSRGQREPASDSVRGQGHSAGQERTEPEPHQHRAALMKGQAARRPSGYADRGFNWSNEMRRSLGEVRYRRTEQDKAGRRGLLLGIMGQTEEETFITVRVCWAKLKIFTSEVENSYYGHSKGLKWFGWNICCECLLENQTFKSMIYHNKKIMHLTVPEFWLFGCRVWTLEQNSLLPPSSLGKSDEVGWIKSEQILLLAVSFLSLRFICLQFTSIFFFKHSFICSSAVFSSSIQTCKETEWLYRPARYFLMICRTVPHWKKQILINYYIYYNSWIK